MSETRPGKIIKSGWAKFVENDIKFKLNIMTRQYKVNDKVKEKIEYVILVDQTERPNKIITTEFGPTCGICLTSDYIKEDNIGTWFNKKYNGCTCTRCGAATFN